MSAEPLEKSTEETEPIGTAYVTPFPMTANFAARLFDNLPDLMTIEEVAFVLRKSPKTIKNAIAKREMPFVPIGKEYMVLKESFVAWLKKQEFVPWQLQR